MSKQKTATNSRKGGGKKTKAGSTASRPRSITSGKRSRSARAAKLAKNAPSS